ncbi:MAG: hypothetical protein AB8F94_10290 [Saprospiraceae bacterium]
MKLNYLLFLLIITVFACSKDDEVEIVHTTDSSLNNCFELDSKSITDIVSDGAYGLIDNFNNEYIFYSSDENLLIKVDNELNEVWRKSYPHLSGVTIDLQEILQTSSGEIIIIAHKLNEYSEVTKVSSEGALIWKTKFEESNLPHYRSVLEIPNNEYILSGSANDSINTWQPIVTKINEEGEVVWTKFISSPNNDILKCSSRNNDQNLVLGVKAKNGDREIFYHFIDSEGNYTDRTGIGYESGWDLESISLSDNGFLTLSSSDQSTNGDLSNTDYQLIKIDEAGEIEWTQLFGGDKRELPAEVIESKDGGYYILGNTTSFGFGGFDLLVIKTDESGNIIWQNTYGTAARDVGGTIIETENSDLIIGGVTGENFNLFMFKIDKDGTPK